jgi:hypothetical protein
MKKRKLMHQPEAEIASATRLVRVISDQVMRQRVWSPPTCHTLRMRVMTDQHYDYLHREFDDDERANVRTADDLDMKTYTKLFEKIGYH